MARDERIAHLAAVPLFASLSRRELQTLAKAGEEIAVPTGKVLVDQGATGREAFIVLEGTAIVRRGNRKIATLGTGDWFGELALLDHEPRTASVTAETQMRVYVIDSRHFEGLLEDIPSVARKLLTYLARRVRELDRQAYG
jgi:CRP-like cAMP-binding protein